MHRIGGVEKTQSTNAGMSAGVFSPHTMVAATPSAVAFDFADFSLATRALCSKMPPLPSVCRSGQGGGFA
jgi:hypothetical protein